MCGIVGSLHFHGKRDFSLAPLVRLMKHRGPDESHIIEQDFWSLGLCRLAITAPEEKHTQPLWSPDKRFCFAFNGEIYNHKEIKALLRAKGWAFKSSSDAEVLFYAYLQYGQEAFIKSQGMFACAVFDSLKKTWTLVRDPFGIKPLYFFHSPRAFVFASEIKPLLSLQKNPSPNKKALAPYLQKRFVPGRETFFEHILRVLPGEMKTVQATGHTKSLQYRGFSNAKTFRKDSKAQRFEEFSLRLRESCKITARSESPIGALLSGGLDSSVVAALACEVSQKTPSAWFFDNSYDKEERTCAIALAEKTGWDLRCVFAEKKDFLLLPKVIRALEEPLADSIIVPTYKLMKAVSQEHKVALSGEGADEILAGYSHHRIFYLFHKYRFLQSLAPLGAKLPSFLLNALFPYPGKIKKQDLKGALRDLSRQGLKSFSDLYALFNRKERERLVPGISAVEGSSPNLFSLKDLMIFDMENWLCHYNLLRTDKLSMAFSLELRLPYLNWDFADFALGLPQEDIISLTENKKILRRFARGILSPPLSETKQGKTPSKFKDKTLQNKLIPSKLSDFYNRPGLKIAGRKKHPFTFKESAVYSKEYREFVWDHLSSHSFKSAYGFSGKGLSEQLKAYARLGGQPDLRAEKQIAGLLNLAVWTKEFF